MGASKKILYGPDGMRTALKLILLGVKMEYKPVGMRWAELSDGQVEAIKHKHKTVDLPESWAIHGFKFRIRKE